MSEVLEHDKKKRLKGFGAVLEKQLKPLETNEKFMEKYKNFALKILLNPIDQDNGALIEFNDGKVNIKSISNQYEKNLKKKVLKWDGMMATTTPLFLKIGSGEINDKELKKLVLARKIKVKGTKELKIYSDITNLLK